MNRLNKIIEQLESCNFEGEGGNLENNVAFIKLVKMSMEMRRNQFFDVSCNISELKTETKRTPAKITLCIPTVFADTLLKQIGSRQSEPIQALELRWLDTRLDNNGEEL